MGMKTGVMQPAGGAIAQHKPAGAAAAAGAAGEKKQKRVPRPMNSFMIFAKTARKQLQTDNPTLDNKDISKLLGDQWKSLSETDRAKYAEEAKLLAEQHKIDNPEWKFRRNTRKQKRTLPGQQQAAQQQQRQHRAQVERRKKGEKRKKEKRRGQ